MANVTGEQKLTQESEELEKDLKARIDSIGLPTANIMVAGITGTGKSTLINAVFGAEMAPTGSGRPVTADIKEYHNDDIPINIWDTVGLELNSETTKESIKSIKATIASKSSSSNPYDRVHAIWYCINSGSNRYQGAELEFIKELYSIGVPFIIVLTQCSGDENEVNAFENEIRKINASRGMYGIKIVQVLALPVKFRGMPTPIPAFGLEELVNTTLELLPNFIKSGFVAAQRVSQVQKRDMCEDVIFEFVDEALKGFWDKVPIINIFTVDKAIRKMFIKIGKLYNTNISEEVINKLIADLGNIDIKNGFFGLICPHNKKYTQKLNSLFEQKNNAGFKEDYTMLPSNQRAARLLAYYGYIFLDAIEQIWEELTVEQLRNMDILTRNLSAVIKEKMKNRK